MCVCDYSILYCYYECTEVLSWFLIAEKVDPIEISTVRVGVIVILLTSSFCLLCFFLSYRPICHDVNRENVFLLNLRLQ